MDFKHFIQKINNDYIIENIKPHHAKDLENLQRMVFPTLKEDELLHEKQYLKHIEIFPEGQFVITYNNEVIAATTTLRYNFDINHPYHNFKDIMGGGWLTTHNPNGLWLYGLDVSVHPNHRGRGLAKIIYQTRHRVVKYLNLKGQVIVGMMSGYGKLKDTMKAEEYYNELKNKKIFDPTVGVQMKLGFEIQLLMPNYLNDPICDNYGVLMTLDANKVII